ncbi:hypothetical protein FKM82_012784 [Ascaphus truei]
MDVSCEGKHQEEETVTLRLTGVQPDYAALVPPAPAPPAPAVPSSVLDAVLVCCSFFLYYRIRFQTRRPEDVPHTILY